MKKLLAGVIGLLVAISGVFLWNSNRSEKNGGFQFGEVSRDKLEILVSSTGTLSAVETVQIGAQVSANLEQVLVDFNDKVKKGQMLAVFDTTLFKAEEQKAEAELARAKVKFEQADAEYQRNVPLFEKGFISGTEFLVVKSELESASAQLQVAKANVDSAQTNLRYAMLRSPIDGTVIERNAEVGQTIVSRMTTPTLFIIAADLSKMQIQAYVDESDIGQIREGLSVRFTVQAYPDNVFQGTVRQVRLQPKIEQNVVNYTVIVDAHNPEGRLLPGMTATVDFVVEQKQNVLMVQNSAIQFRPPPEILAKFSLKSPETPLAELSNAPQSSSKDKESQGRPAQGRARVFVMDQGGSLRSILFKPGLNDGKRTEIAESTELVEGTKVIIGLDKQNKGSGRNGFHFPGPPRR